MGNEGGTTSIDEKYRRHFLFEAFVRSSCGFSPQAEYMMEQQRLNSPREVVNISYHVSGEMAVEGARPLLDHFIANRFGGIPQLYGMRTPYEALSSPEEADWNSLGMLSLRRYEEEDIPSMVPEWSPVAIDMQIEGITTGGIELSTRLEFREMPPGKLHLTLVLVEKELPAGNQNNHMNDDVDSPFYQAGSPMTDYVFRNVARTFITPSLGQELPMEALYRDMEYNCSYQVEISEDWQLDQLEIVGFVHRHSPEPFHQEVYNVRSIPVNLDQGFATFSSFGFLDLDCDTVLADQNVVVTVPFGTDLSSLTAVFQVSDGPVVLNGVIQESAVTSNDYRVPQVYTIGGTEELPREVEVQVLIGPDPLPQVTTVPMEGNLALQSNIAGTSIKAQGNITAQGDSQVTEAGICWSTLEVPDIKGDHLSSLVDEQGSFSVSIPSLTPETLYYIRSYAINAQGTSYGDVIEVNSGKPFGEDFGGGLVYFNDGAGKCLVVSETPVSPSADFSNEFYSTELTSRDIGSGLENTLAIINQSGHLNSAAELCYTWPNDTHEGWFLPSIGSLIQIYDVLHSAGHGSFIETSYCSSSEVGTEYNRVSIYSFSGGGMELYTNKTNSNAVLGVRWENIP